MVHRLALMLMLYSGVALAQASQADSPAPGLMTRAMLTTRAARRFPQPARVGDLVGRAVLQPEEAQPVLGRVEALTRYSDGSIDMVIRVGTVFGLGGRLVAVPTEAVALLGEHVALIDYTPAQLASLPTIRPGQTLPAGETIKVGLVKPFH